MEQQMDKLADVAVIEAIAGERDAEREAANGIADHLIERAGLFSRAQVHNARNGYAATSGSGAPLLDGDVPAREVDIAVSLRPLQAQLNEIEIEIERLVSSSVKSVADVASHTLGAGGKRLRPALTILAAQLCDSELRAATLNAEPLPPKVLAGAVAVELTHTTTLLHDDVVDGAEVRRGKPAANLVWGNGMSVLVGDYLFAQVFLIASQRGFYELMNPLAQATAQMCAGELLEVQKRGQLDMSEDEYEEIVALKTGALTECACRIGALSVQASADEVECLARYGHFIGIAFQIVDDVFDIVASKKRIGKPVGNDIREGVVTLPMLRAMQNASETERAELQSLIGKSPINDDDVARALELLRAGDGVESSLQTAMDYVAQAKAQLESFADCPAREMLYDIADYVLSREK